MDTGIKHTKRVNISLRDFTASNHGHLQRFSVPFSQGMLNPASLLGLSPILPIILTKSR